MSFFFEVRISVNSAGKCGAHTIKQINQKFEESFKQRENCVINDVIDYNQLFFNVGIDLSKEYEEDGDPR